MQPVIFSSNLIKVDRVPFNKYNGAVLFSRFQILSVLIKKFIDIIITKSTLLIIIFFFIYIKISGKCFYFIFFKLLSNLFILCKWRIFFRWLFVQSCIYLLNIFF